MSDYDKRRVDKMLNKIHSKLDEYGVPDRVSKRYSVSIDGVERKIVEFESGVAYIENVLYRLLNIQDILTWADWYEINDSNTYRLKDDIVKANKTKQCKRGRQIQLDMINSGELVIDYSSKVAWNKGKMMGPSWNKGLTKHDHPAIMEHSKRMIENNPSKNITPDQKLKYNEYTSKLFKERILNGEMTPNIRNRLSRKDIEWNGLKYRSSWEVAYHALNPQSSYEQLRLKYTHGGIESVYVVDFIDHVNKVVVEVKPYDMLSEPKIVSKMNSLVEWADVNGYNVQTFTEIDICENINTITSLITDSEIIRKINYAVESSKYATKE